VKRTQDDKWMLNLQAAKAFHAREGHLNVSRKHVEQLEPSNGAGGAQSGAEGEVVSVKLGMVLDNLRKRADKLTDERWAALNQLGMRWAAGATRSTT